ncbi:Energy-coupling factor transporter ATP-binding protein EcfA1 [Pelotomaculum schinkii]|uniref:Energy-coupling factor transporter ATP-binding protein EcfA1 n=1 Tax=Pelotomaculum schinkii TaxID=78350 RepID=A0A4Y7REB2_9FIRM|nr:ABC transporter ATP-binding protein [Pelotomaculum schinkii]TEB07042.1 Energy-coupling factor transporter ATP-binding protein EcfA1 [Pelotomaculum schinkii]
MAFLELSRVVFSYPRKMKPALAGIDLSLDKDGVTAIVGPNGSGKTTLTKLLIGVLQPTEGEVRLEGRPVAGYSLAEIGRRIGYVFQNPDLQLFCSTVAEEVGFGLANRGCEPADVQEKVAFYLDYFELTAYRDVFPLYLSQGEKQRLAIAAVLANEPEFLILDEPTIGLDACRKKNLEDYLKKVARLGRGMILVSHDERFVDKMAERVVTLANGRIQSDSGRKVNAAYEA